MDQSRKNSVDTARLLPRHRPDSPMLERRRMVKSQAAALAQALEEQPERKLPLRHELTKPGDPEKLRGIPVMAPGIGGASGGTRPESCISRIDRQRERLAA